ncbi:TrlF family AAA-like ATPase [Paraburkholderia mimosarum]|uniref:TrlF family AAA-like ATPase n=1 Tax=Paraburkholderia mimosarum TaxID=312026 RepID=UPI00040F68D1|nr:AAA family ATPase [Paraburkholderia mimosarum]
MAEYDGMRWVRCDLQIQTPEDSKHWLDDETKLAEPRTETDIQAKARVYLKRCHAVGLHVIGVTDHNFSSRTDPREWFLTHLIEQNKTVAEQESRQPLVIFPGFEIDIGYHLLCLFEPVKKGEKLARISDVLSTLGLAPTARFNAGQPAQLRHDNAAVSLRTILAKVQDECGGIVIAAHAFSNRGICDDSANIGDFALPNLLCVEVSEFPLKSKAKAVLEGTDSSWKRVGRPPAYIMSSDTKSLQTDEHGKPNPNSLGYRSSWLKMSQPSIEGLRQAFLDSDSRIRLTDACPSDQEAHPRIISVRVKGAAFLDDQEVNFSPNLNCIIGGRGTGKSSMLEYLRFALETKPADGLPEDIKQKHDSLRKTLEGANAEVHVTFEASTGVLDTVVIKQSEHRRFIADREVADLNTVLEQIQVQFFSQGELTRLAKPGQNHVLRLVDAATGDVLAILARSERDLKGQLEQLGAAAHRAKAIKSEVQRLTQEVEELGRQWQARKDIQVDAAVQQRAKRASTFVTDVIAAAEADAAAVERLADEEIANQPTMPEAADEWPQVEWLRQAHDAMSVARQEYQYALKDAASKFRLALGVNFGETSQWPVIREELNEAEQRFVDACKAKGLQPDDVTRLQEVDRQRQSKQRELDEEKKQFDDLTSQAAGWGDKLAALHKVWRDQFEARKLACERIQSATKATSIEVNFMRDETSFLEIWQRLNPHDNRKRLGKNWDEIGAALFETHAKNASANSPWELIELWRTSADDLIEAPQVLYSNFTELLAHLDSDATRRTWEEVRLTRVADFVDVELMRPDGVSAGKMSGAGGRLLSEGQRNTALLNLMLVQGSGPIVIDQPEDELDASYIFSDLVPLIRSVKSRRQLIIATHNANLPVNADAELIYAIEASEGRGRLLAEGGLDRGPVTLAVLNIMEGSEQAFKQRSEKYHF